MFMFGMERKSVLIDVQHTHLNGSWFFVCMLLCLPGGGMLSLSVCARECFAVFYAADDKHQSIRIRSLRGFAITDGH